MKTLIAPLFALVLGSAGAAQAQTDVADAQSAMIDRIEAHAGTATVEDGNIAPDVLEAMAQIPRHEFVPEGQRPYAYQDRPLPIGHGQTISQPFIVAMMTDLLNLDSGDTALEVGTGSGYQAAVLSPLADEVYSIEIVPELGRRAAATLDRLGFQNVDTRVGDGYYGWPEAAPFDGIVVTAAASHIPPPLVEQLATGGRMVIPIGGAFSVQQLMLVEKQPDGSVTTRELLPVRFVPFTRGGQ